MNRAELKQYIAAEYGIEPDHPWADEPNFEVFRHTANRKWFALIMEIPKARLGLPGEGDVDVVNLKCDPILIGSMRAEPGFFPAYHMNKTNWITAALDGSAQTETVKMLLDMSFAATAVRKRQTREK